jgi:DNA-binding MarR family transcriptional regulator
MGLEQELGLKKGFSVTAHEAVLNIYYTAAQLKKEAGEFFRPFGLTDVQFNVMMLLHHQSGPEGGLSQAKLSDMMLVNRANITSLIDRMERSDLVVRTPAQDDRRYNIVKLTGRGKRLLAKIEPLYANEVRGIMTCLKEAEQNRLKQILGKIRGNISRKSSE